MVRGTLLTGAGGEIDIVKCGNKERKLFHWLSFKAKLAVCDGLSLAFQFHNLEAFIGLGLGLLTQANTR